MKIGDYILGEWGLETKIEYWDSGLDLGIGIGT